MPDQRWKLVVTKLAERQLHEITDLRVRDSLKETISNLAHHPEEQGKPLLNELAGDRSVRALGQRYRVIFKTESTKVTVYVVSLGLRKAGSKVDVYEVARKLMRLALDKKPE
ncbi:MAG: type II toxin-antitoxin system RelE family toxin [Ktedonobacterales bacterium]